ncbi:hypothetical protein ACEWY4_011440 [Coilia grayii]|uniref:NEDD4-binding protein 1 n=1 Tax=Coilia grayii TaxID=363190 RepID=A0ABD1K5E4_9TELE
MSTTRPLDGMKRITELTCTEPSGNRVSPPSNRQQQEALTVDEFTVPEDKQAELKCAKPRVEQVFRVDFTIIGLLDHTGAHGSKASRQIWLKLMGKKENVLKAKEYVKGLCDPELQKEERYPVDMHCIFAGARGLFLERLQRDTSAEVLPLEPGRLRMQGRAEAVVMAQSRVQQFVALFHEKRSLPGDREPAVKRSFKTFVEERTDKYAMELLLLPSALKEELLGLAQSPTQAAPPAGAPAPTAAEQEQDRSQASTPITELSHHIQDASFEDRVAGHDAAGGPLANGRPKQHKRRSSESEQRSTKRQYSLERREEELGAEREAERQAQGPRPPREASQTRPKTPLAKVGGVQQLDTCEVGLDETETVSPETNLRCLVNFFRTMGYQQDVVERVVREAGQTEDTFLLLERIVEESERDKSHQPGAGPRTSRTPDPFSSSASSSSSSAATLSYMPRDKDRMLVRAMADVKAKENIRPTGSNGLGQHAVPLKKSGAAAQNEVYEVICIDDDSDDLMETTQGPKARTIARFDLSSDPRLDYLSRGGSQTMGPVRVESVTALRSSSQCPPLVPDTRPSCSYQTIAGRVPAVRTEASAPSKSAPLTGVSRFQQSLRTPYRLVLQDEPGRTDLRHVIIDGSNVAMSHGNHRIFSCRGIAIAVEHFWRRGHREITVFVPQWRQKRDPNITEQHFLSQLEDLRLLSFTPSREVCGQRIASHDDRFLLHLAEKTDGVIVTNDNLRDFVSTSEAWRSIIQHRLLPFTFVEDHFMIPDDPLGKHGPHVEVFLRKENRPKTATRPQQRSDVCATPAAHVQPLQRQASPPQARPASHWPHTGAPGWIPPPRPPPSTSPPPQRTALETSELKRQLYDIFPDQKPHIDRILSEHPYMRDLNALSGLLLG